MQDTPEPAEHYFRISLVLPKDEEKGRKWTRNETIGVVSADCRSAIALALVLHPDGRVIAAHSHGAIHVKSTS